MASTTIPDTKSALVTMLQGISTLTSANVQIRYADHPERARNCVWLGDVQEADQEPASFRAGTYRRHEDYTVELFVETVEPQPEAAEVKAYTYLRAIEEALAADPKISDTTNLSWAYVEETESKTVDSGEGAVTTIEMTIRCRGNFV